MGVRDPSRSYSLVQIEQKTQDSVIWHSTENAETGSNHPSEWICVMKQSQL